MAYECQHLILRRSLASELNVLANQLARIAEPTGSTRDFTLNSLRDALAEVIACFPVYRTYVADQRRASSDRRYIDWAIARRARRRSRATEATGVRLRPRGAADSSCRRGARSCAAACARFAMKFQQITAPVTAKGIEDTAFYRFNRLISLNEVGGDPGASASACAPSTPTPQTAPRHWPHDAARHLDPRHQALRGRARAHQRALRDATPWRRRGAALEPHQPHAQARGADGAAGAGAQRRVPAATRRCSAPGRSEPRRRGELAAYRERIEAYMLKAVREAKVHTSWINADAAYEEALLQFVRSAARAARAATCSSTTSCALERAALPLRRC